MSPHPTAMDDTPRASFPEGRRLRILLHAGASTLLVMAILVMLNYLAARHPRRIDLTQSDRFTLSPQTLSVLQGLTNDVRVTLMFKGDSDLIAMVHGMLQQWVEVTPRLLLERIDPDLTPGRSTLLRERLHLGTSDKNVVIFESGKEIRVVRESELSEYDADIPAMMAGKTREVRRSGFKGEALFLSAVLAVSHGTRPKVCFLQGHGEHDPRSADTHGYQKFLGLITEKNAEAQLLSIDALDERIPDDCQLLVIAGPTRAFSPQALERIDQYLARGGRLLVLFSVRALLIRTGLEELLGRWGIIVKSSVAADDDATTSRDDILVSNFGVHPVVNPLAHARLRLQILMPRVVAPLPDPKAADAPRVEALLWTSDSGRTKSRVRDGVVSHSPDIDIEGRIPLAAAAEKGSLSGVASQRGVMRVLAVGDSTFLGNTLIEAEGNRDFAGLAVAWLLDQPQLVQIGPKAIREYSLRLTPTDLGRLRWLLLLVLPGGVLSVGGLVWFRRRS